MAIENARVAALVRDSLRIVEKKVVQVAQTRDAIDVALARERMARCELAGTIDSLQARVASLSRDREDGTRMADFNIRAAPRTIAADAVLPPMPDSAMLDLRIRLDSIPMMLRLGCSIGAGAGIRTATVTAESPPWARLNLRDVSQTSETCSRGEVVASNSRVVSRRPHIVVGVGRLLDRSAPSWGAFVGVALFTIG